MLTLEQHPGGAPARRATEPQHARDFPAALLAMAGHDLRQPLQIIQSTYEWLGTRVSGMSERVRLERGERAIARLTEQLDRLIGALRLYEQTERMELTRVPLAPLLAGIARDNEEAARDKAIKLRVSATRAAIMSNPVLLDGILSNLVRNAVKYTEPGGRILIGCRRWGPDIRIDVFDTGIGMAPEHLPRIFEPFQRLEPARADGLGIGLFVVRRAVELLGHRVDVSSALSRGSRFSVFARAAR